MSLSISHWYQFLGSCSESSHLLFCVSSPSLLRSRRSFDLISISTRYFHRNLTLSRFFILLDFSSSYQIQVFFFRLITGSHITSVTLSFVLISIYRHLPLVSILFIDFSSIRLLRFVIIYFYMLPTRWVANHFNNLCILK